MSKIRDRGHPGLGKSNTIQSTGTIGPGKSRILHSTSSTGQGKSRSVNFFCYRSGFFHRFLTLLGCTKFFHGKAMEWCLI